MDDVNLTEKAILMCQLAEHQDKLDEIVDQATIEYLNAQAIARQKLQKLRHAINIRDAMSAVRKHIGVSNGQIDCLLTWQQPSVKENEDEWIRRGG